MPKPTVKSIIFVVLLVLSITGALIYRHAAEPAPSTAAQASLHPSRAAASCVDFAKPRPAGDDISAMRAHAKQLADASHYDQALAQYREIAAIDPGAPALNLDISRMLLKLGQPKLAKEAINTQIEVSECLPHLPLNSMDEYCKSENFPSTLACVRELNSDQQSAYLQAALVQMELGRGLSHDASAEASATPPTLKPTAKPTLKPTASSVHATSASQPAHTLLASRVTGGDPRPKPIRHPNPNQLASGSGTDAALGAYSK